MESIIQLLDNLELLMQDENLSYEALGKKLGMSPVAMRQWRRGAMPSIASLYKLANYFDISADYLLGLSQDMEWKPSNPCESFITRYDRLLRQSRLRDANIARLLGTTTSTVAGWRNGKIPVLPTLIRLSKIFDCSYGYIAGISEQ